MVDFVTFQKIVRLLMYFRNTKFEYPM